MYTFPTLRFDVVNTAHKSKVFWTKFNSLTFLRPVVPDPIVDDVAFITWEIVTLGIWVSDSIGVLKNSKGCKDPFFVFKGESTSTCLWFFFASFSTNSIDLLIYFFLKKKEWERWVSGLLPLSQH